MVGTVDAVASGGYSTWICVCVSILVGGAVIFAALPHFQRKRTLAFIARGLLSLRYKVTIRGLEKLPADKGVLLLPNHPCVMDPIIFGSYLYGEGLDFTPLVAENQYKKAKPIMDFQGVLVVPDIEGAGLNAYMQHELDTCMAAAIDKLDKGERVLMYPAGRLMSRGIHYNNLGASALFTMLSKSKADSETGAPAPREREWVCAMVKIHGLWGSQFGKAYTSETPDFFGVMKRAPWLLLKNLIFFMPRRHVDIDIFVVDGHGKDHPDTITSGANMRNKLNLNQWLKERYNHGGPENLLAPRDQEFDTKGTKGKGRVPYSFWSSGDVREVQEQAPAFDLENIDNELVTDVKMKLAKYIALEQGNCDWKEMNEACQLNEHYGLDSLQLSGLVGWLDEQYNVEEASVAELKTVGDVVMIVATRSSAVPSPPRPPPAGWEEKKCCGLCKRRRPGVITEIEGNNLPEAFLHCAKRMGDAVAVADDVSGVVSYKKAAIGAMLFADFFRARARHPNFNFAENPRIGVMLPSVAGFPIVAMGIMLACKTPVMINWTVGAANLAHVLKAANLRWVITSRSFLLKLGPEVVLKPLFEKFLFIEDLKANIHGGFGNLNLLAGALRFYRPLNGCCGLKQLYNLDRIAPDSEAVVLFTSGSESAPKGVPLTHTNIKTNVMGTITVSGITSADCVLGILPPFHSFGFTVTSMLPIITGTKVSYYPNPTEYRRLAKEIGRYKPTLFAGTPTFLRGVLDATKSYKKTYDDGKRRAWLGLALDATDEDCEKAELGFTSCKYVLNARGAAPEPKPAPSTWLIESLRLCVTGAEKTPQAIFDFCSKEELAGWLTEVAGLKEIAADPMAAAMVGNGLTSIIELFELGSGKWEEYVAVAAKAEVEAVASELFAFAKAKKFAEPTKKFITQRLCETSAWKGPKKDPQEIFDICRNFASASEDTAANMISDMLDFQAFRAQNTKRVKAAIQAGNKSTRGLKRPDGSDLFQVCEGYGITETSPVLSCVRPVDKRAGVGKPIPTNPPTRVLIVKEESYLNGAGLRDAAGNVKMEMEKQQNGQRGAILVKGPGVFGKAKPLDGSKESPGYLGMLLTEKDPYRYITVDGEQEEWYDTGDLGKVEPDDEKDGEDVIFIMGRAKRFVKIAGEMLSLGALEDAMKNYTDPQSGLKPYADGPDGPVISIEGVETEDDDGHQVVVLGVLCALGEKIEWSDPKKVETYAKDPHDGLCTNGKSLGPTLEQAKAILKAAGAMTNTVANALKYYIDCRKCTYVIDPKTNQRVDLPDCKRWAEQQTLPLLGTGKTNIGDCKKMLATFLKEMKAPKVK